MILHFHVIFKKKFITWVVVKLPNNQWDFFSFSQLQMNKNTWMMNIHNSVHAINQL